MERVKVSLSNGDDIFNASQLVAAKITSGPLLKRASRENSQKWRMKRENFNEMLIGKPVSYFQLMSFPTRDGDLFSTRSIFHYFFFKAADENE